MPPRRATAQRAKPRRQASEEEEEEDDIQSSPPKQQARKGRQSQAGAVARQVVTRPAAANAFEEPLNRDAAKKLQTLLTELNMNKNALENVFSVLIDAAEEVGEAFTEEEDAQVLLSQLDQQARDLMDKIYESDQRVRCVTALRQSILAEEIVKNGSELFANELAAHMEKYNAKTARQKYGNNENYEKLKLVTWSIYHPDEHPPKVKSLIEIEPGDEDDEDDEIELATFKISFKCPISLRTLEEPMTSTTCKHSYSKAAIEGYFEQTNSERTGRPAMCPVTGCSQALTKQTLVRDTELDKRVKRYLAQQAKREKDNQAANAQRGNNRRAIVNDDDEE